MSRHFDWTGRRLNGKWIFPWVNWIHTPLEFRHFSELVFQTDFPIIKSRFWFENCPASVVKLARGVGSPSVNDDEPTVKFAIFLYAYLFFLESLFYSKCILEPSEFSSPVDKPINDSEIEWTFYWHMFLLLNSALFRLWISKIMSEVEEEKLFSTVFYCVI